jgi:ABC-type amino acid transport system permease subunit
MKKYFSSIVDHWKNDWNNRRLLFWLELGATLFAVSSAMCLSLGLSSKLMLLITFSTYIISNILGVFVFYMRQSSWLIIMNFIFFIINIIGIVNLILHW